MKVRKGLMAVSAVAGVVAGFAAPPAMALSGLLHSILPPIPDAPPVPPILENLPGILPANLPDGAIPNFVLELPLPIPNIPLPALPLPPNQERNTVGNCGAGVDLTQRMVVVQRNLLPNNQIEVYARGEDGSLCSAGVFNTGGAADLCGIVCSSQDSVIADRGYIFAASPGSADCPLGNGTIAVFRLEADTVTLTDVESSGGPNPRSVARSPSGDMVYVGNGGVYIGLGGPAISTIPQTVQGFRFDAATGNLTPIAGSNVRSIDAAGDLGQIVFTGDGTNVVVTNRRTSLAFTSGAEPDNVETYTLGANGAPVRVQAFDVGGDTPFGGRMLGNNLYLTHGGPTFTPNLGGSSVWNVSPDGGMNVVTPFTRDQGDDTCWNAIVSRTTDRPYNYSHAFFDSAISKWAINPDGSMTLEDPRHTSSNSAHNTNYVVGEGGIDIDSTDNGAVEFVYAHNNAIPPPLGLPSANLAGFRVAPNGDLERLGQWVASGLPNSGFGTSAL